MLNAVLPSWPAFSVFAQQQIRGNLSEEFIINNYIGIHPLYIDESHPLMMLLFLKKLNTNINILMRKHSLSKVAFCMAKIAASFYPNVVGASDLN
jgi:hypothetical protein